MEIIDFSFSPEPSRKNEDFPLMLAAVLFGLC
jgi:hypothetical protein